MFQSQVPFYFSLVRYLLTLFTCFETPKWLIKYYKFSGLCSYEGIKIRHIDNGSAGSPFGSVTSIFITLDRWACRNDHLIKKLFRIPDRTVNKHPCAVQPFTRNLFDGWYPIPFVIFIDFRYDYFIIFEWVNIIHSNPSSFFVQPEETITAE